MSQGGKGQNVMGAGVGGWRGEMLISIVNVLDQEESREHSSSFPSVEGVVDNEVH